MPYFPPINIVKKWYLFSQVPKREIQEGIEVFHPRWFIIPNIGMTLYGISYFLSILFKIKKIQKEFNFDIIDTHFLYPDGFAGVLIAKVLCKPVIISARGGDVTLYFKFSIIRFLSLYALKKVDKIIAVAESLKDEMIKFNIPAEKIMVIPNGVDIEKFHPINMKQARGELNLPLDKKILLSVGSLVERKGFHYLIDAVNEIVKRGIKDILLIIIGGPNPEGDFSNELKAQIDRLELNYVVKLVGAKTHNELYKWYSAADLFCLASLREGCPNVVLESLACGLPVICSRIAGIPQIITSSDYGILMDGWDKVKWAEAILQALNKKWDRKKIVEYAHKNTWDKVANKVLKEFNSVLAEVKKK